MKIEQGRPATNAGRLEKEIRTYDFLDSLGLKYERVDHAPAMTMEDCVEIDQTLYPAAICKNLFLCNQQKTRFYLLLIRGDKKFKTKEISSQLNCARLSFGPPDFMERFLDITPGSLSVLGLMNDKNLNVNVLVDLDLLTYEYIGVHPCINTSTLRMLTKDVFETFVPATGHDIVYIRLSSETSSI